MYLIKSARDPAGLMACAVHALLTLADVAGDDAAAGSEWLRVGSQLWGRACDARCAGVAEKKKPSLVLSPSHIYSPSS